MTKDGLTDKAERALKAAYDAIAKEPVPEDMRLLLAKLK